MLDEDIPMNDNLSIILLEYEKLKEEQISRISTRDSLIYITLGIFGAIFSFSVLNNQYLYSLLIIPVVSFVLGWVYITNDEKISNIGKYIREDLFKAIKEEAPNIKDDYLLHWEIKHRSDELRIFRKITQFFVDLTTFSASSFASIAIFMMYSSKVNESSLYIIYIDGILCFFITMLILFHADFKKSEPSSHNEQP